MIILDENFPDSQRQLLKGWRISFKQVGNSTPKINYRSIGTNDFADKLSVLTGLAPDLSAGEAAVRRALERRQGRLPVPNSGGSVANTADLRLPKFGRPQRFPTPLPRE
jgi:hypothetical protein